MLKVALWSLVLCQINGQRREEECKLPIQGPYDEQALVATCHMPRKVPTDSQAIRVPQKAIGPPRAPRALVGNILRTSLWAPRTHLKMMTKRPKERPTKFTSMAKVSGKDVNVNLPLEDHPTMLLFPRLGPPGILVSRPQEHADMRGMWVYRLNLNPASLSKYGIQSIASAVMNTHRFSQMLAKIAHSFAVARFGLHGFTPILLDHILHTGKCPWHFVGGRDGDPTVSNALHEIEHEECETVAKRFLLVRVRLFANLGAPGYVVVTGELPSRWAKDL